MDTLQIPTTIEEARAMAILGLDWLREHAPDQLRNTEKAMYDNGKVNLILYCPVCTTQHIDAPETDEEYTARLHESSWWECGGEKPERWNNPPHRSHLCHECGHIWRPSDTPTNGVAEIVTKGKNDSVPFAPAKPIPFGTVTTLRSGLQKFYPHGEPPYLDNAVKVDYVYTLEQKK